jgi:hypothetical protein
MLHARGLQGKEKIPLKGSGKERAKDKERGQGPGISGSGMGAGGRGIWAQQGDDPEKWDSLHSAIGCQPVFRRRFSQGDFVDTRGGTEPKKTEDGTRRLQSLAGRSRGVLHDPPVTDEICAARLKGPSGAQTNRDVTGGSYLQHFDSYCIICYNRILDRPPRRVAYPAANNRRGILSAPRP